MDRNYIQHDSKTETAYANPREQVPPTPDLKLDVEDGRSQSTHSSTETPPTLCDVVNGSNRWEETTSSDQPASTSADQQHLGDGCAVPNNDSVVNDTKFTFQQKATFVSAMLANFTVWMCFPILAVFFPNEAKARGFSQTFIGLVFSSYSFSEAIGAAIFGKIIPLVGARFMFLAGAFITAGCNALFGFVIDMDTHATFAAFSFLLRIIEGLGTSACSTAAAAIVAHSFPQNTGTAVSLLELSSGLSIAIGPVIGGLLYNVGGFRLPFLVVGGLVLLTCGVNSILMADPGSGKEDGGSVGQLLSIPAIWIAFLATFTGFMGYTIVNSTLSFQLQQQYDFSVLERSLTFAIFGAVYGLTSILWGHIADKKNTTTIMMGSGAIVVGAFFLVYGPSPFFTIPPLKWFPFLAVSCVSTAFAAIGMPSLIDMFKSAEWYGIPKDLRLTSAVSGLYNAAMSSGAAVGPLMMGALTDQFGFGYASTIIAGVFIVVLLVICLFGIWEYRCGKGRRLPRTRLVLEEGSTEEEGTRLLTNHA